LRPAKQVVAILRRRSTQELAHKCWSIHPIAQARAGPIQTPNQGHAVWRKIIVSTGQSPEGRIVPSHRNNLCVGKIEGDAAPDALPPSRHIATYPMKLIVFSHTPPPHHGQSYMVQLMLAGFGGDRRKAHHPTTVEENGVKEASHDIHCYHVNARLSQKLEDIG